MKIEEVKKILQDGEEIEFKYKNKNFSITFFEEKGKTKISFCEFYKKPIDVDTIEELFDKTDKKNIIVY